MGEAPTRRPVRQAMYRRARRLVLDPPGARLAMVAPRTVGFVARSAARGARSPLYPDPPAPRPTPGLALQVAMDEAMLAMVKGPRSHPRRPDYRRLGDEVRAGVSLAEERGWLDEPLAYHRTPPALDPAEVSLTRQRALGVRYEHLQTPSGFEPRPEEPGRGRWVALEANRTAHAYVLRHRGDEPRPWLVCVHGFGMGQPTIDFVAFKVNRLHRELGLNVVLPVLPTHGPRASGRLSGTEMMGFDLVNAMHGLTQATWDIRRLVGWIRAQGATSVGLYGISLGGYTTALVAGIEPGLDLAIAAVPPSDIPALMAHHAPAILRRRGQRYEIMGQQAAALHRVVSPLAVAPLVPRAGRHIVAGLGDRMSTPKQAYRLWQHWDRPNLGWYGGNHVGYFWSREADRFVTDALTSGFAGGPGRPQRPVAAVAG